MSTKAKGRPNEQPENSNTVKRCKDNFIARQVQTIFLYWQHHIATASMVSAATGIPHKNICRYKRDMEKAGRLWEVRKSICAHTKHRAWYCTTNPRLAKGGAAQ